MPTAQASLRAVTSTEKRTETVTGIDRTYSRSARRYDIKRSISASAILGFVSEFDVGRNTVRFSRRRSLTQLYGRKSRNATITGTSPAGERRTQESGSWRSCLALKRLRSDARTMHPAERGSPAN